MACTARAYGSSCVLPTLKADGGPIISNPYYLFHPVLDGEDIAEYPTTSILHGRFKDVPLMVG